MRDIDEDEDEVGVLAAQYAAGPGARPTRADAERWLAATKDGLFPRRVGAVHIGSQTH